MEERLCTQLKVVFSGILTSIFIAQTGKRREQKNAFLYLARQFILSISCACLSHSHARRRSAIWSRDILFIFARPALLLLTDASCWMHKCLCVAVCIRRWFLFSLPLSMNAQLHIFPANNKLFAHMVRIAMK